MEKHEHGGDGRPGARQPERFDLACACGRTIARGSANGRPQRGFKDHYVPIARGA